MLQRLEESTRVVDVRGVMAAASAYAVLGGIMRVYGHVVGEYPLGLMLLVYVLAAGAFARRAGRGWARDTARDSALAVTAGIAWIGAEAWAAGAIQAAIDASRGGMNFSIETGCSSGPGVMDVLTSLGLLAAVLGLGAIPIGWAARWLLRLQTGDGG